MWQTRRKISPSAVTVKWHLPSSMTLSPEARPPSSPAAPVYIWTALSKEMTLPPSPPPVSGSGWKPRPMLKAWKQWKPGSGPLIRRLQTGSTTGSASSGLWKYIWKQASPSPSTTAAPRQFRPSTVLYGWASTLLSGPSFTAASICGWISCWKWAW